MLVNAGNTVAALMYLLVPAVFILLALAELAVRRRGAVPAADGRLRVNFGLWAASGLALLVVPLGSIAAGRLAEARGWGLLNWLAPGPVAVLIATFLLRSLAGYLFHVASHKVPLLWRIHRVHHSDAGLDLSTALRDHPLGMVLLSILLAALTILFGMPGWAVALTELALIVGVFAEHLDVVLQPRVEARLGRFFVTPRVHRLHHSSSRDQTDSNFGGLILLWDRLFGTYRAPEPVARLGLDGTQGEAPESLRAQLLLPLR